MVANPGTLAFNIPRSKSTTRVMLPLPLRTDIPGSDLQVSKVWSVGALRTLCTISTANALAEVLTIFWR